MTAPRAGPFALHSDRADLTPGAPHVPILIPFWGQTPEEPNDPARGRYDRYAAAGDALFRLVALEDCDAAIFPESWELVAGNDDAGERAAAFAARALGAGKSPVIFFWSDSTEPVGLDATVFRTSLYRSSRGPREFAQPAWTEDLVDRYLGGTLPLRELKEQPVVGFCGYAPGRPPPATARGRRRWRIDPGRRLAALGRQSPDGQIRARALGELERHPDVDTNFVVREAFLGGMTPASDLEAQLRVRRDFVRNIVESDYVLCARGGGNFSYRLYETLACGRIPLFVDTDCVLPLESLIDWKDYCVWVDETELDRIGTRVASFHAGLTPAGFAERQRACRRLWETHLSPQGFFAHLHEHFP